jgi:hypothetical protein
VLLHLDQERWREDTSVQHILKQLFTYMVVTGVEFAWLSCYKATWLAWRHPVSDGDLYVSPVAMRASSLSGCALWAYCGAQQVHQARPTAFKVYRTETA